MDCRVIISPRAIQDLREIVRYISLDDPRAARKLGEKLVSAAESLIFLPERGRIVPEFADGITRDHTGDRGVSLSRCLSLRPRQQHRRHRPFLAWRTIAGRDGISLLETSLP